jgi:hypothetical protein
VPTEINFCILIEENNFSCCWPWEKIRLRISCAVSFLPFSSRVHHNYRREMVLSAYSGEEMCKHWVGMSTVPAIEKCRSCDFCWQKYVHLVLGLQRCVGSRLRVTGNNSKCRFILRDIVTVKSSHQNKTLWALCKRRTASARLHSSAQC